MIPPDIAATMREALFSASNMIRGSLAFLTNYVEEYDSMPSKEMEGDIERLEKHQAAIKAGLAYLDTLPTERQLEWEPLPDDHYGEHDTISVMRVGTLLEINSAYGDGAIKHNAMIELPDNIRLCRRKEAQP